MIPNGTEHAGQIRMKVNAKFRPFIHTDSQVLLSTAGVLGETFIDIDSTQAKGPGLQQLRAAFQGSA